MARVCVFCGGGVHEDPSKEHVLPWWLQNEFGISIDDMFVQGVASSSTGELTQPPRIQPTRKLVQGLVCGDCNSGWMSRLESAVKPILVPLVQNKRAVWELPKDEAGILGRWAAKTAYVYASVSPFKRPVAPEHLRAVLGDNGAVIAGVSVFGCQYAHTGDSGFWQTGHWPLVLSNSSVEPSPEAPDEAYKIGMLFRDLCLLVAYWPHGATRYVLAAGLHIPVWPLNEFIRPCYRVDIGAVASSEPLLRAFTETLGVLVGPVAE